MGTYTYWYYIAEVSLHTGVPPIKEKKVKCYYKVATSGKFFPLIRVIEKLKNPKKFIPLNQQNDDTWFAHPKVIFWNEISVNDYDSYDNDTVLIEIKPSLQ